MRRAHERRVRSEEHTSELQSQSNLVCRLLLEKKKMPRLDGYQTCSLIKHNKVFRSIHVIMLSSKDGLFDRARGRIVGSEHYLTKPFTHDDLLSAIETHIGR